MIIETVMDAIGTQLDTITDLRVQAYEADEVQIPAGLVSLPGTINYQTSLGPGFCRMTIEVTILVSKASDRIRRKQIAPYADTRGAKSVRAVLEAGTYTAFDSLEVQTGRFTIVTIASSGSSKGNEDYLAFICAVDIIGQTAT